MREISRLILPEVTEILQTGQPSDIDEALTNLHPADVVEVIEELDFDAGAQLLAALKMPKAARAFELCDEDFQVSFLDRLGTDRLTSLIEEMSHDDRADLFKSLPTGARNAVLDRLPPTEREDIQKLAAYPEGTAGALMTNQVATASAEATVAETIAELRRVGNQCETIYWVYATDSDRRLQGVSSLRDLVLADPDAKVASIMSPKVISVSLDDDQEAVAAVFEKYDLFAVPVVDKRSKLQGIVTADDVLDVVVEEATEDMYRLGAAGTPPHVEYLQQSVFSIFRRRLVWLLLLLFAGFLTSILLESYETIRIEIPLLMIFLPFLMGTGGNAGTQAATVIVRGLGTGELTTANSGRVFVKETLVGATLGLTLGGLAAAWVVMTQGDPQLAFTVGVAMFGAAVIAASSGACLPMVFQRLGLDPALMSGPFITTVVDAAIIVIYFECGRVILLAAKAGGAG